MVTVFFSYSRRDETLRNQLETHLSALKREGVIETWHDRRIGAGEEFEHEISKHLETADIILLLISPDFIASDYCYDFEMSRALQRHESGEACVIPVILRPCDWYNLPFGKLQATPTDGKPISKQPDLDEAFLDVTRAIRMAIEKLGLKAKATDLKQEAVVQAPYAGLVVPDVRSSNLRVKKTFTDHDKDQFTTEAFEFIAKFFEGSLDELERRNPELKTNFRRIDANHFTAAIYRDGTKISSCRIWLGGQLALGGIAYAANDSGSDNTLNESLSVTDDGHSLYLRLRGFSSLSGRSGQQKLTLQGGAEHLWSMLIARLQ